VAQAALRHRRQIDGDRAISTRTADRREAERALAKHITDSWQPVPQTNAAQVMIADVLQYYAKERATKWASRRRAAQQLDALNEWWGPRRLSDVTAATCRRFAESRAETTARQQLETLRAAIRFYHKNGLCKELPAVTLPDKRPPRERWLTRDEVARLLWHCLTHREPTKAGKMIRTRRHVCDFILVGIYTARRSQAIVQAKLEPSKNSGWFDLDRELFHPAPGRKKSKKQQPVIPVPPDLLRHLRRRRRNGAIYAVEWHGRNLSKMDYSFREACKAVGLDGVTPHTLRHTCITWLMQKGVPPWQVSGFAGVSLAVLTSVYAHHSPEHLEEAAKAFSRQGSANGRRERNVHRMATTGP
jgi:integrase